MRYANLIRSIRNWPSYFVFKYNLTKAPVARFARAVALIGRDAGTLETVLADGGVPLQRHDSLPAATAWLNIHMNA